MNAKFEQMASLKYELRTARNVATYGKEVGMSADRRARYDQATQELAELVNSLTDAEFVAYIEWTKNHAI